MNVNNIALIPEYLRQGKKYYADKKDVYIINSKIKNEELVFDIIYDNNNDSKFTLKPAKDSSRKEKNSGDNKNILTVPFLDLITSNFNLSSVAIFGKSNTGKTYYMKSLLSAINIKKYYDLGIYITGTPNQCFKEFGSFFNRLFVISADEANNTFIKNLSKIQEKRLEVYNFINNEELIHEVYKKVRLIIVRAYCFKCDNFIKLHKIITEFDEKLSNHYNDLNNDEDLSYDAERSIKKKMILIMKIFLKQKIIINTFNKFINLSNLNKIEMFVFRNLAFSPYIILVLDDIGSKLSSETGDSSKFSSLHAINRHYGILILYLIQSTTSLTAKMREGMQINIFSSSEVANWYSKYSDNIMSKKQLECFKILSKEYFYRNTNDYRFLVFMNPGGKVALKDPIRYTSAISDGYLPLISDNIKRRMIQLDSRIKEVEASASDKERIEVMFEVMAPPKLDEDDSGGE